MTRQLIMIDWLDERPVSSLPLYYPPCISPRMNLVEVLQLLQKGGSHIAFVCAGPDLANKALEEDRAIPIEAGFMGLVTLEDVLEAILQDRIYDEEDVSDRDLASALLTQWAAKVSTRHYKSVFSAVCLCLTHNTDVLFCFFRVCKDSIVIVFWLNRSNRS